VDDVVGAGPGLLAVLTGQEVDDVSAASHLVGLLYPDGHADVDSLGLDRSRLDLPPGDLGDLLAALDHRNEEPTRDLIDVRVIERADGSKAYIVDIPGTKVWDAPGFAPASNDLGTNVHVLGGDDTAREAAVAEALRRAGAGPGDPVMLVGHSQGGMLAAQAAHDSRSAAFPYNVTHVVTAGSPIARVDIPPHVQVLALENRHDIVPHLDARDNRDRPNVTTVTFDAKLGSIGDNHGTATAYLPAARLLDGSNAPSIEAYRRSAAAFLGAPGDGSMAQTSVYELSRRR
jgi:hypothetical protein